MGNIVLFSVFTAILLQEFDDPDEEDEEEEEEEEIKIDEIVTDRSVSQKIMNKDTWVEAANAFKLAFGKKLRLPKTLPEEEEPEASVEMADQKADENPFEPEDELFAKPAS